MESKQRPKITVVGSSNVDLISYVPHMPKQGQTLFGTDFKMGFGGKGANQAVMASRLGAQVYMVTKLGDDSFGRDTVKNYETNHIDTKHVLITSKASSGVAPISVDPKGHNCIIVVPGANNLLTPDEVEEASSIIASSSVLICQNEIPLETTMKALKLAKEHGVKTIFNPAPAPESLPAEIFPLCDLICPNETEAESMTGISIKSLQNAETAAKILLDKGAQTVILTLGGEGSLLVSKNSTEIIRVPAEKVEAKDTTGAGDCFIGSLAVYIAKGDSIEEAMKKASKIASISVQHTGTQTSFPYLKDLPSGYDF